MITVEMKGFNSLIAKLGAITEETQPMLDQALIAAGFRIQRAAKKLILDRQGIGQYVTRYRPKRNVIAAGPGQPPNSDTGILVNSIYVNTKPGDAGGTSVIVGTDLLYGRYLELGTSRMLAHPWLVPAFESTAAQNSKAITMVLDQIRKKLGERGSE